MKLPAGLRKVLSVLWDYRRAIIIVGIPLVFLPVAVVPRTREAKCAYVILVMAFFWMTEVLPLGVTALLPAVLFPLMGVLDSKLVASQYLKDTNMLFIGGLMVAIAIEHRNLHRRIAVNVMTLVGSKPRWLMLGIMLTTFLLSMWISNTAASAMMVPIAEALINQLITLRHQKMMENKEKQPPEYKSVVNQDGEMLEMSLSHSDEADPEQPNRSHDTEKRPWRPTSEQESIHEDPDERTPLRPGVDFVKDEADQKLARGLLLCICYGAAVGGTATLTGSPPNLVMANLVDAYYGSEAGVNFASWFAYAIPISTLMLFILWCWLQLNFLGWQALCGCFISGRNTADPTVAKIVQDEKRKLGKMSFAEIEIAIVFGFLVVLWFTRDPKFMPGWGAWFAVGDEIWVSDATAALFVSLLFFILPAEPPFFLKPLFPEEEPDEEQPPKKGYAETLLNWDTVQHKMPWGIIFLLGGGFALAQGVSDSGLSEWVSGGLSTLDFLPVWVAVLLVCLITMCLTEIVSNTATANIVLPLLSPLAVSLNVSPLLLMYPSTICASFAFTLPVATPPNAIVFGTGELRVIDMARVGIFMDLVGILLATLMANTYGYYAFNFGELPDWATVSTTPSVAVTSAMSASALTSELSI